MLQELGGDSFVERMRAIVERYLTLAASPDDIITCIEAAHGIRPDPAPPTVSELELHRQRIGCGQMLRPAVMAVAALIPDIERRATLVLRYLRKYPALTTMCCDKPVRIDGRMCDETLTLVLSLLMQDGCMRTIAERT